MKQLEVVAAIIWQGTRFLSSQRIRGSHSGRWEFPGGKIDPGETRLEALHREIREELDICVDKAVPWCSVEHHYNDKTVRLHVFHVLRFSGEPRAVEGQPLRWLTPDEARELVFLDADIPLVAKLHVPQEVLVQLQADLLEKTPEDALSKSLSPKNELQDKVQDELGNELQDKLSPIRASIDAIDEEIVRLLARRLACSHEVGRIKRANSSCVSAASPSMAVKAEAAAKVHTAEWAPKPPCTAGGLSVLQPEREAAIIHRLEALGDDLPAEYVRHIWTEIFSYSRQVQDARPVAVLGPVGGTGYLAARLALGRGTALYPCTDTHTLADLINSGTCALGVLPVGHPLPPNLAELLRISLTPAADTGTEAETGTGNTLPLSDAVRELIVVGPTQL